MSRQQTKEQCSSSDNDIFMKRPSQLDKVTSQQSTNWISSLQRTKPINEQISLSENNALVFDSVNTHQLHPQLHDCTTLQCPLSLQYHSLYTTNYVWKELVVIVERSNWLGCLAIFICVEISLSVSLFS